ncbi:amidohydrolase [Pestalotiopsis sp. NC0098]|nr:amidohydrolase [Pestalotiopsis sp. NC0098]
MSSFEFINIDESENHKCEINLQQRPRRGLSHVESFAELTATVYPPDPQYDISEKPWLPGPQKAYLLTNAKIVDPRAGVVRPNMSLQLTGGKIIRISPTTARDVSSAVYYAGQKVEKIDASDYFVCPGLIDCHVHLMAVHGSATLHGAFTFPHETAIFRSAGTLRGILSNGFTTVRDTGGATIAHAQATEEFLIPGPRVFQGGRMLSQTGGHGDDTEVWTDGHCCQGSGIASSALGRLCDGVPDCLRAARDNMRKGANHLKVCTSGGIASATDKLESLQFTVEELQAITTVAKNMGATLVTAHCYTAEGIRHAIAGGVRGIEHGNMLDSETARLMADEGIFLTPTLALHTFVTMPPYDKFETPEGLRKNAIVGDAGVRAIRYAEEAGVCVCYGTDTTGPTLVMQTYEFVVRSKLLPSPVVLRQATINGAKQIGMEGKLGELVEGAFADLLFLRENPLEDVSSLDRINENLLLVMKDGRIVKSRISGLAPERNCEWN